MMKLEYCMFAIMFAITFLSQASTGVLIVCMLLILPAICCALILFVSYDKFAKYRNI